MDIKRNIADFCYVGLIGLKFQQQLHNGQCPVRRLGTAKTEFHLRVTETHLRNYFHFTWENMKNSFLSPLLCV